MNRERAKTERGVAMEAAREHLGRAIEELEKAGMGKLSVRVRRVRHATMRHVSTDIFVEETPTAPRRRRLLSAEDFGKTLNPPKARATILRLCREGRVVGAIRPGTEWVIPEGAQIRGKGHRIEYGKNEGLSVREYANMHGRSAARAYVLLKQGRIEGARKGPHGWDINPEAPWPADDGF